MIQKIPPISPHKQLINGIMIYDITCKDNLEKIFKPSGFVACVKPSSIETLMQRGWNTDLIHVDFTGKWKNEDSGTNDIANIVMTQAGSTTTAQVWDTCDPNSFCDWGKTQGTVDGNKVMFTWKIGSVTHNLTVTKTGSNILIDRESVSFDPKWTQTKQMKFIPGILISN